MSDKHKDDPIVFIAINSGNAYKPLESYAAKAKVPWPLIVDTSRELEGKSGLGEITLKNIHQVGLILPSGQYRPGSWKDLEGSVQIALAGATWNIDPTGIPESLKDAWRQIEFGDYAATYKTLAAAATSNDATLKQAAIRLHGHVMEAMTKEVESITASTASPWKTYRAMRSLMDRYQGYRLPPDFVAKGSELHQLPEVQKEIAAGKALAPIKKGLTSKSAGVRSRFAKQLDPFIAKFTGTEAASEAQQIKTELAQ